MKKIRKISKLTVVILTLAIMLSFAFINYNSSAAKLSDADKAKSNWLQNYINNKGDNGHFSCKNKGNITYNITSNHTLTSFSGDARKGCIVVQGNTNITINGNNKTITNGVADRDDFGNVTAYHTARRLIKVPYSETKPTITIKNLTFKNFKNKYSGAVIKASGAKLELVNCKFINCYVKDAEKDETNDESNNDFGGGAIYTRAKNTVLNNCTFENCHILGGGSRENKGGAIKAFKANSLTITNCHFKGCYTSGNSTDDNGGALHAYQVKTITINNTNNTESSPTFENNSAHDSGGALHVMGTSSDISKLNIGTNLKPVTFKNNRCSKNIVKTKPVYTGGGAINTYNCNIEIGKANGSGYTTKFIDNLSFSSGGAIYSNSENSYGINNLRNAYFEGNRANSGGAVCSQGNKQDLYENKTYTYLNNCVFYNNQANVTNYNDGTANNQNTYHTGGAISAYHRIGVNNTKCYKNYAISSGGAFSIYSQSTNNYINTSYIDNKKPSSSSSTPPTATAGYENKSPYGGGVYVENTGTLSIGGNTKISGNIATTNGGGVYNNGEVFTYYTNIYDNSAQNGGGIFNNGTLSLKRDGSKVYNNTASSRGGGIFNVSGKNFRMPFGEVSGNEAQYGGGVYNAGVFKADNQSFGNPEAPNKKIKNNTATTAGGGIYNLGTFTLNRSNHTNSGYLEVSQNTAGSYGCGIFNNASGTINQTSPYSVLYCGKNNGNSEASAEFFNEGTVTLRGGKAITDKGGINISGDSGNTTIGSTTSNLYAINNNKGVFNLIPDGLTISGTSYGFNIKSPATHTIRNNGTLNIQSGTVPSFITALGENGIYNEKTLNCNNPKLMFTIIGPTNNAVAGIKNANTATANIRAHIMGGLLEGSDVDFKYGIENEGTITQLEADITLMNDHAIYNKGLISTIINSYIQDNGGNSINGGGLYADENSQTTFEQNNIIKWNTAQNGGGIYAKKNSRVYLGSPTIESKKSDTTTSNSLIENVGTGANIYIEKGGYVRDLSTYHTVDGNYNSVNLDSTYKLSPTDSERAQYHIGYNTYFDRSSQNKPYVLVPYGTYIDVDFKLANQVKVSGESVYNIAQIYVKSTDNVYNPVYGIESSAGRIIANQNIQDVAEGYDINYINDGTTRFLNYKTNGNKGLTTRYSYTLSDSGKNKLYTLKSYRDAEAQITYSYNSNEEIGQNLNTNTLSCNNKNKKRQVYLTETHEVRYFPHTGERRRSLTQAQMNSVKGLENIPNAEIKTHTYTRSNITYSFEYAVVTKYWCEDLNITGATLQSNFGAFNKKSSWETLDGDKVYSIYDTDNSNDLYTEEEDVSLFAIWDDSQTIVVSHYIMNQDGSYDNGSDYTSYMKFSDTGSHWTIGLLGSPNNEPYLFSEALYSQNEHSGFGSYHCIDSIPVENQISETYIKNNLLDNRLIKENVSYYANYELVNFSDGHPLEKAAIKIFYNRKQYTMTVEGDSGLNSVEMHNPYQYTINYSNNTPTITRKNTYEAENASTYSPIECGNYIISNNTYVKFNLKANLTYRFDLTFSEAVGYGNYGLDIRNSNNDLVGHHNVNDSNYKVNFDFTPKEDGAYYFASAARGASQPVGVPDFAGKIYAYNSELINTISVFQNNTPSTLNKITRTFYAVDEDEYRENKNVGINGFIMGSGPSNVFNGIFIKNSNNSLTKTNSSVNVTSGGRSILSTIKLPKTGNVNYLVSTKKDKTISVTEMLERQGSQNGQTPHLIDSSHMNANSISCSGVIKVKDIKNIVSANSSKLLYVDINKTPISFFNGRPGNSGSQIFTLFNEYNDDDYLPADKGELTLQILFNRKTFTVNVQTGSNAYSSYINKDNQTKTQTSITEKYFLDSMGANAFGLPVEEYSTVYIGGQVREGYSPKWSSSGVVPYDSVYASQFKTLNTGFKLLGNHNATFTLQATLLRTITINHYLMDTNGVYNIESTSVIPENVASYLTSVGVNSYVLNKINGTTIDGTHIYFDRAVYGGENYTRTQSIPIPEDVKDASINIFYGRAKYNISIYANHLIDSVTVKTNGEAITNDNITSDGKITTITAYYGQEIDLSSKVDENNDGYDVSFGGYSIGANNYSTNNTLTSESYYNYTVSSNESISIWGIKYDWKYHIVYHANAYIDNSTWTPAGEQKSHSLPQGVNYEGEPNYTQDINWNEQGTVAGEIYSTDNYEMTRWVDSDGNTFNFNDPITRSVKTFDDTNRRIDLYAIWKSSGPRLNIYAEDLYFEVNDDLTESDVLKKIIVSDGEGHVLSNEESNLGIVKIQVEKPYENVTKFPTDSEEFSNTNLPSDEIEALLNTENAVTYLVTVRANYDGVESNRVYKVIVYENLLYQTYIRAIDKSTLSSLPLSSIWRNPFNYARLIKTLNKGNSDNLQQNNEEAKYIFAFNASDMQEIQQEIKNNGYKYKDVIKDRNITKKPKEDEKTPSDVLDDDEE